VAVSFMRKFWSFWPTIAREAMQDGQMPVRCAHVHEIREEQPVVDTRSGIRPTVAEFFPRPRLAVIWPRAGRDAFCWFLFTAPRHHCWADVASATCADASIQLE